MRKKAKRITAFITCLVVVLCVSSWLGWRLLPLRSDFGATWHRYTEEDRDSIDVLFLGSSIAYCDIMPSVLYEKTGIPSYMVCGPELTASLSYYYLKEALKTQSPQVVYVEATSFFFPRYTSSTKINVGYMPYSLNRLAATFRGAEKEERLGLLFPLYNYHSRWEDLSLGDYFGPRADRTADDLAGYTRVEETAPQEIRKERDYRYEPGELEENLQWLEKIIQLCRKENISLRLFVAPACEYPSAELTEQLKTAAGDIPVTDYNDVFDTLNLDPATDFHDFLHLNHQGALKFSETIAEDLSSLGLTPGTHDRELWQKRALEK